MRNVNESRLATGLRVLGVAVGLALPCPAPGADTPVPPSEPRAVEGGRPGFGGRRGPGGPGGMMQQEIELVARFDQNGDARLDATERRAARDYITKERSEGRNAGGPPRPFGPRRGGNRPSTPPQPGPKVSPADVAVHDTALYDPMTLRTLFLEFENEDWEAELADFNNSDVEVPATLTVDGRTLKGVGVHFRGMSSFGMVGAGQKRSLNLSLDFTHKGQQLGGYRTLNLLNSHEDPTFLRTVLYLQIAREYVPAPKANLVRVVINGESWGVYVSAQQFNKDFVREWYGTTGGNRWKVPGSPMARAGLDYLGEDPAPYKRLYSIKSKDTPKAWADLIRLCKVMKETPADQLEAALSPLLDIDGTLKALALENALINNDGYWIRSSDYSLYQDEKGQFHFIPHDANETFSMPGGPGMGGPGGPGGPGFRGPPPPFPAPEGPAPVGPPQGGPAPVERAGGPNREGGGEGWVPPFGRGNPGLGSRIRAGTVELDPLIAADDEAKPLLSKILAVPALRTRYLGYVREIAEKWLDWEVLGPIAHKYHDLIAEEVARDTRKLDSTEEFEKGLDGKVLSEGFAGRRISLKDFADKRREYLLKVTASAK